MANRKSELKGISLGTFPFTNKFGNVDRDTASEILKKFIEHHCDFIHVSLSYNRGKVQSFLGTELSKYPRDAYKIMACCGWEYVKDRGSLKISGSASDVRICCEKTLEDLKLSKLDVLMLHKPDEETPYEKTIDAMVALKEEGKCDELCVSNVSLEQLKRYNYSNNVNYIQNRFSLINPAIDREIFEYCQEHGIKITAFQSIERGLLTDHVLNGIQLLDGDLRRYKPEFKPHIMSDIGMWVALQLKPIADRAGLSLATLILKWTLQNQPIDSVLCGVTKIKYFEDCIATVEKPLEQKYIDEINEAYDNFKRSIQIRYNKGVREYLGLEQPPKKISKPKSQNKILVIGLGPVGLSTAIGFAEWGYEVVCYDIDSKRINMLKDRKAPFVDGSLQEYLDANWNKMVFTNNVKEAFKDTNIFFLVVGTPQGTDSAVDMTAYWKAINTISEEAKQGGIIVIKSTVPVGTNTKTVQYLQNKRLGVKLSVVSNPEFLAQGTSIWDVLNPSRIVIGCSEKAQADTISELYSNVVCPKIITTPESAEIIKYESNCYLAMRVSYVNDLAMTCNNANANLEDVLRGVSLDPRIGVEYFKPGFGYGGSCFPKDTVCYHNQIQREFGHELELIQATIDINERQKLFLCREMIADHKDLNGKNILLLGVSFKKGTDEVRNSLSIGIIEFLLGNGANITAWDPVALENCKKIFGNRINYADDFNSCIKQNNIILIGTDWDDIVDISMDLLKRKSVYDGKNCLLPRKNEILDFNYTYIGGKIKHAK